MSKPARTSSAPWVKSIGFAVVPLLFTAAGSAVGQVLQLPEVTATLLLCGFVVVSALFGVLALRRRGSSPFMPGFTRPQATRQAWFFIPPVVAVIVAVVTQGIHVPGVLLLTYLALSVAVGINEEVWFRGVILGRLSAGGTAVAIIGSSVLFGALHLANLAGGESGPGAVLQVAFALAFGFAAGVLTVTTRSVLPAIIWHAAWDFVNFAGGNSLGTLAVVGTALATALIVTYGVGMAVRLRKTTSSATPAVSA